MKDEKNSPFYGTFLISVSLVAAVEVSTSKNEYSGGETVAVTISDCQGTSIVNFLIPAACWQTLKAGRAIGRLHKQHLI